MPFYAILSAKDEKHANLLLAQCNTLCGKSIRLAWYTILRSKVISRGKVAD